MRHLKFFLVVAALSLVIPASSQVTWGPKIGINHTNLSMDDNDVFDADGGVGFIAGLMVEAMIPGTSFGFDASFLYARVTSSLINKGNFWGEVGAKRNVNRDYLEIPINFKWKISIPALKKILIPSIYTGPTVSFLCSKKYMYDDYVECRTVKPSWRFGIGFQILKSIHVGVDYSLALNTSIFNNIESFEGIKYPTFKGKDQYWSASVAYLF